MYNDGFGHLYHPKAAAISVRDLIRCYPYVTEKNNVSSRVDCPRETFYRFHTEVEALWKEWTKVSIQDYFSGKADQYPQYGSTPPWKGILEKNTTILAERLRISTRIVQDFHQNHRSYAVFDAETFFQKEQSVEDFQREMEEFMKHAKQRIKFKWPMAVGRIMLDEGDSWIPRVVDGSCREDFEMVSATMSRLLYDVLLLNFNPIKRIFEKGDKCVIKMVVSENTPPYKVWDTISSLMQLAKIPCVEHLLYPRHFPAKEINITGWFSKEDKILSSVPPTDIESLNIEANLLETEVKNIVMSMENLKIWKQLYVKLCELHAKVLALESITRCPPISYDRSNLKKKLLKRVCDLKKKTEGIIMNWQAANNTESHRIFASWAKRLCDADIMEQLQSMGDLEALKDQLKERVSQAHTVYSLAWDLFTLPDVDVCDYYEITRLSRRLGILTECVWKKIDLEKEYVTRKVADKTSTNYFEAESIERELNQTLRKYRGMMNSVEVQRIAVRLSQLTVRCRVLNINEQELEGQRVLLGLPEFTMDVPTMLKLSEFFSELAEVQFMSINHEDSLLQSHVMDISLDEVLKVTASLSDRFTKLEADSKNLEEQHFSAAEPVMTRISEAIQQVQKILPVISTAHNQGMKDRHWQEIFEEEGPDLRENPVVKDLLERNITDKVQKLEEISAQAEKEMLLEATINSMRAQWSQATFEVRSKGILISDELTSQMTAHIAKSQQIMTSPYIFIILEQLKNWLDTLLQLHTFVELHKQCDRLWQRVEGVFSTEDVAYQMPSEFRTFKKISLLWQQVNSKIAEDKPILDQLPTIIELNGILNELHEDFSVLEKGFHSYLRKKRLVFPRLHLFDDTRLLYLLSISREPVAVNKVIRQLFPHVRAMIFNKRGEITEVELTSGKILKLAKAVNVPVAKRHVEKWLAELDRELRSTVRLQIKALLEKHSFNLPSMKDLRDEEVHVAVVFYRVVLTHMVEEALRHSSLNKLEATLCQKIDATKLLGEWNEVVRALVFLLYHYTEIISTLLDKQVVFTDDIWWKRHIRMYWNLDQVFIRVFDLATRHDYDVSVGFYQTDSDYILRTLLSWNRFHVPLAMSNCDSIAQTASSALGRSLLVVSAGQPIEAGLWTGAITISTDSKSWIRAADDVYKNTIGGSNKVLVDGGEVPVNASLMTISTSTERRVHISENLCNYLTSKLTIAGFSEAKQVSRKINSFFKLVPLVFNISQLPKGVVENILKEIVALKTQGRIGTESTSQALCNAFSPQIIDKDWIKFTNLFFNLKHPPSNERKEEELLQLLSSYQAIIVLGASLSGKSTMLKEVAAKGMSLLTQEEFLEGKSGWFVLDGNEDKISWVLQANKCPKLSSYSFPQLDNSSQKIIYECDTIPEELDGNVPVLRVNSLSDIRSSFFTPFDILSLSAVIKNMPDFVGKMFKDRVTTLIPLLENANLIQAVIFVLNSLNLAEEEVKQHVKTFQETYPAFIHPPTLTWESVLEQVQKAGYVLFVRSTHGFSSQLEKIIAFLETKELITVEMNLNTAVNQTDVEDFLRRSELLFGGEKNVIFCLKDFQFSSKTVHEFLRKKKSRRYIVASSEPISYFPERLRRFLFAIPDQKPSNEPEFPLEAYENLFNEGGYGKDVEDATRSQLVGSLEEVAKVSKEHARLKRELSSGLNSTNKISRRGELFDATELLTIYKELQRQKRMGPILDEEPIITEHTIWKVSLIEKCFFSAGCSLIVCTAPKDDFKYWIDLTAKLTNIEQIQTEIGVLTSSDIHQALRVVLLEDRPVLLTTSFDSSLLLHVHSLAVSRCIPPLFLSQQLVTEFCEKHTVEGRGVWRRIAAALKQYLKICILVPNQKFSEFHEKHKELTEVSIIEWSPKITADSISFAVSTILEDSKIFDTSLTKEKFIKKLQQIVNEQDRIDLIKLFVHIAQARRESVNKIMSRYERGMDKLRLAEEQTASLQVELSRLRPELLRTSIETSILMSSIERETIEVENAREVVAANEARSQFAAQSAQTLRADCEADLANAYPALQASIEALETLNQNDVSTLKTMRFPPYGVRICMEAVCILLGEAPARVPNPDGGFVNDYWPKGLKMLSDIHFLSRIRTFPRDQISRKTMKIVKERYLSKPEFDPEHIKQCSLAAEGLCLWVKAIEYYHRISRIVEPKKEKLRKAELLVKTHLKQLEVKRKALQKVTEKLQHLSDQFGQMSQKKQDLQTQISTCEARIARAERLVDALEGEKEKWLLKMQSIREDLQQLPQHCLTASLALQRHSSESQSERKASMSKIEGTFMPQGFLPTNVDNESLLTLCSLPFLMYNDYGRGWTIVSQLFHQSTYLSKLNEKNFREHCSAGSVLFMRDSSKLRELIERVKFGTRDGKRIIQLGDEETEVGEGFRLFISSPSTLGGLNLDSWKFSHLNMDYSKEELKEKIVVDLGKSNWPEVQKASDEARAAVRRDVTLLDETETKMLELLGRKEEDLDDEGAVELLAVAHATQEQLKDKERALTAAEEKLKREEEKFEEIANWATDAVLFIRNFSLLSDYCNLDVEKLIELCNEKFEKNNATLELTNIFWNFCYPFMNPDQRKLLHFGLHSLDKQNSFTQEDIEAALDSYEELDQMKMLERTVWAADPIEPILIRLAKPYCEVALAVKEVARGTPVQWTSFPEYVLQNFETILETASWLAITLSGSQGFLYLDKMKDVMAAHPNINPSFRLLIVVTSTELDCLAYPTRVCFSSAVSLRSLIERTTSYSVFKQFFHSAVQSRRSNALRFIVFHFAVRSRFESFDDLELRMGLTLLKESTCDEDREGEDIFERIVSVVYLPRAQNVVDRKAIENIFLWIFVGLNKMDDLLIRPHISGIHEVEEFLRKLKKIDDRIFTGRSQKLEANWKSKEVKMIIASVRFLYGQGSRPAETNSVPPIVKLLEEFSVGNALHDVDVANIHSPRKIIALLAFKYAEAYKTTIDEVIVTGHLEPIPPSPYQTVLKNCLVQNCRFEKGEIKEQENDKEQRVDIILQAEKRLPDSKTKFMYLLHGNEKLCSVAIHSNVSIPHWHLRGSHFST